MANSEAQTATIRINNYNMALGRWLGMLLFSVLPTIGFLAWIPRISAGSSRFGSQEFFILLLVLGMVVVFGLAGWWTVLWAKFGDKVTLLRFYGLQRLPWSEIKALRTGVAHSSVGNQDGTTVHTATYKGLRIETANGGKFLILPTAAEMASLKRTLEARGHSALLLEDPKADLTDI